MQAATQAMSVKIEKLIGHEVDPDGVDQDCSVLESLGWEMTENCSGALSYSKGPFILTVNTSNKNPFRVYWSVLVKSARNEANFIAQATTGDVRPGDMTKNMLNSLLHAAVCDSIADLTAAVDELKACLATIEQSV